MVWYTDVDGSGGGGFGKKNFPQHLASENMLLLYTKSSNSSPLIFTLFSYYLPTSVLVLGNLDEILFSLFV